MIMTRRQRRKKFEFLGLGEYNETNIKKLQSKYFPKKYVDGKYGKQTDILLRNLYRTTVYSPHFKLEEFKCECGGRYCTGYPYLLNVQELLTLEKLRVKVGSPLTITSGLRCKPYNNSLPGSSPTSLHLYGCAVDITGTATSTLSKRKDLMAWLTKQHGHRYTYCNGWEMGTIVGSRPLSAPYMGTSIHFDKSKGTKATKADKKKALEEYKKKHLTTVQKALANADKWAKNNKFHYVNYESGDKKTQMCPICNPELQKIKKYCGWNCIGFVSACYFHAGVKTVQCRAGGIVNDGFANFNNITEKKFQERNGKDWKMVWKKKSQIPTSKLKAGDVMIGYQSGTSTFKHIVMYAGNGYIYDCTSGSTQCSKRKLSSSGRKYYVVFRWTGK